MYSLDVLHSLFGISLLFHVQFCCFLTCLRISQEAGQVVGYFHLLKKIKKRLVLGRKAMTNLDSVLKNRDINYKGPHSQSYGVSHSHVWM